MLRWVSEADLPGLYKELEGGAFGSFWREQYRRRVSCPGSDTCKLGISSSRGLAAELRERLLQRGAELDETIRGLHIKVSGCFNSCGQHHLCDLGFYGMSRVKNGFAVPHFQVMLGGEWEHNAGSYGLAIGAVPSKRIPEVVDRFTERYTSERTPGETFGAFIKRIGKAECKKMVDDLMVVPPHEVAPEFYKDWGDAREYGVGDLGEGECAGEIVSPAEFQLTAAEREAFEAQLALERGEVETAVKIAMAQCRTARLRFLSSGISGSLKTPNRSWSDSGSISTTHNCSGTTSSAASSHSITLKLTKTATIASMPRRPIASSKRPRSFWKLAMPSTRGCCSSLRSQRCKDALRCRNFNILPSRFLRAKVPR